MSPLRVVLDELAPLLQAEPEWGLVVVRALRSLESGAGAVPAQLVPWVELHDLAHEAPNSTRLAGLLDRAAEESKAIAARERLATEIAYWLPPAWAEALDEVRGANPRVDPRFRDLSLLHPERAIARIEQAMAKNARSATAAGLLYCALLAWLDSGRPIPDRVHALQQRFEAEDRDLVHAEARYVGRLRLAARQDPEHAAPLAEEAVDWLGVHGAFTGVWALLHRVADPRALVERLAAVIPRTPSPEVLIDALWRVTSVSVTEVAAIASAFERQVAYNEVWGERAWIAGIHLLGAAVGVGAREVVPTLAVARLPPWEIELATWRALRTAPGTRDEVLALLSNAAAEESWGLDWEAQDPPWAGLGLKLMTARLGLLTDTRIPLLMNYAWGEGAP